ncbi:MAG: DUF5789 family protein [Halarchaeum sp.]
MADDEAEEDAPAVELGSGPAVEGAPLARVAARFTWGIQRSEIVRREGDTEIRTPDGPRPLAHVLDAVDVPYFESRREFEDAVRAEIGDGPVPTVPHEDDDAEDAADADDSDDADAEA